MIGYVSVNMEEMKIKEYREYRGWYCGLCRELSRNGGVCARMMLSYDMTFLYMLLSSLYDKSVTRTQCHCPLHPLMKHLSCETEIGEYAADMSVLLGYYDLRDDWIDEKKIRGKVLSSSLKKYVEKISKKYPGKYYAVRRYIKRLSEWEKKDGEQEKGREAEYLDQAAGFTGEMLGEIFVYKKDMWEEPLRRMGFYLGKFIYLMDAWVDVEKDVKSGNYNPFHRTYQEMRNKNPKHGKEEFDAFAVHLLEKMAAECCRAFEMLPIVDNVEILRNILYSGIWAYDEKKNCRKSLETM